MFRTDRLATLYFFHPLRRLMPPRPGSIPVLMYHSISEPANTGLHPYFETATSPRVFAEQIKFLYENHYQTVCLSDVALQACSHGCLCARHSELSGTCHSERSEESAAGGDAKAHGTKTVPWLPVSLRESVAIPRKPESRMRAVIQNPTGVRGQASNSEFRVSSFEHRVGDANTHGTKTAPWLPGPTADCRPVTGDRRVVITFDDGFQDFYTHAFPVLNRYGYQATMFLPTAFISETPRKFKGADCLTWSQVRELHEAGARFGSHTVNHPKLTEVAPTQREYELRQSKLMIEDKLGCGVDSFAYPYAFPAANQLFTQCLRAMLEDAGYGNGVSTVVGTADPEGHMFFMKRLPVNSYDDLSLFQAKLEGGYDWTYAPQYFWKKITARRT